MRSCRTFRLHHERDGRKRADFTRFGRRGIYVARRRVACPGRPVGRGRRSGRVSVAGRRHGDRLFARRVGRSELAGGVRLLRVVAKRQPDRLLLRHGVGWGRRRGVCHLSAVRAVSGEAALSGARPGRLLRGPSGRPDDGVLCVHHTGAGLRVLPAGGDLHVGAHVALNNLNNA
jgi:hypothetical protein